MANNESRSKSHRTPVERSQNSSLEKAPLEQLAKEEWSKIPVERCKKLIDGYRKRLISLGVLPNIKFRVPNILSILSSVWNDIRFRFFFLRFVIATVFWEKWCII